MVGNPFDIRDEDVGSKDVLEEKNEEKKKIPKMYKLYLRQHLKRFLTKNLKN